MAKIQKFIFICTGSDCKKQGSKKMIKDLEGYLKEDKKQSSNRVLKTKCMDYCKKAPNAIVSDIVYHKTTAEELRSLL